jgi:hypothetical protein
MLIGYGDDLPSFDSTALNPTLRAAIKTVTAAKVRISTNESSGSNLRTVRLVSPMCISIPTADRKNAAFHFLAGPRNSNQSWGTTNRKNRLIHIANFTLKGAPENVAKIEHISRNRQDSERSRAFIERSLARAVRPVKKVVFFLALTLAAITPSKAKADLARRSRRLKTVRRRSKITFADPAWTAKEQSGAPPAPGEGL